MFQLKVNGKKNYDTQQMKKVIKVQQKPKNKESCFAFLPRINKYTKEMKLNFFT